MLSALKFVKGAVAKKDFAPELVHYRIKDGRALGYNGKLAISAPIDCQLDVTPKALPFFKAIETCQEVITMDMTKGGKLTVKSGKFRAHVECLENGAYPPITPEGATYPLAPGLYARLALIRPFVAADASRPWAQGVLLRGNTANATNNIILVQHWSKDVFPVEVNLPEAVVNAMCAVKEDPVSMQLTDTAVTFHYEDGRWIRCQLYTPDKGTWPDINRILVNPAKEPKPVPEGFWEALGNIKPFLDDLSRVYFKPGGIATDAEEGVGSSVDVEGLPEGPIFNHEMLTSLEGVANKIDFTAFPQPCMFFGDMLRGCIVGLRM
jgi:hypothetical protein